MPQTKIATCCYCGTRAALVLKGDSGHELACSACGAPLHDLKRLPADHVDPAAHRKPKKGKKKSREAAHAVPMSMWETALKKPKKRKKKKSNARRLFGEAFDLIEDILD